jgi:uncharacterized protein (DUF983 family)
MKPEPVTVTDVAGGPVLGERTIVGTTWNVVVWAPLLLGVPVTVIVYFPYVDPVPTVKLADVIVPVLPSSVHETVTTFNAAGATDGG